MILPPAGTTIVISEAADKGDPASTALGDCGKADFIELYNPLATEVNVSGMVLSDNHGHGYDREFTLGIGGCPQMLAPKSFFTYCKGDGMASGLLVGSSEYYPGCGFEFGVGDNDEVGRRPREAHSSTHTRVLRGVSERHTSAVPAHRHCSRVV